MRKRDEVGRGDSCLSKSGPEEMIFVLRGKDPAAPAAIREWCAERIRLGKNAVTDEKIQEALQCARTMEAERIEAEQNPAQ